MTIVWSESIPICIDAKPTDVDCYVDTWVREMLNG